MEKIKTSTLASSEIISNFLLILSLIAAICVANITPFQAIYKYFIFFPISFGFGPYIYKMPLINLVNDGLMTLFFLIIGLELKFHLVCGEFKEKHALILPSVAAIGGIVVPAAIYIYFNFNTPTIKGWAIPIATDTAFMLGLLSFFKHILSAKLRAFVIGFSLIDDALALLILAVFYTKTTSLTPIFISIILIFVLFFLNRFKVTRSFYYLSVGFLLWMSMIESGIHGTLCGVILALAIPVKINNTLNPSFNHLENSIRPLVYFFILPLFLFINSGISFHDFSYSLLTVNITAGIIWGLFIGKPLGVLLFCYIAIKSKICTLPEHVSWKQFFAVAFLGGIGFTLSLFIGDLTFEVQEPNYAMRLGVIIGSLLSALAGIIILLFISFKEKYHLTIKIKSKK